MEDTARKVSTKPCPICGEMIHKSAVFCRHCRADLKSEKANYIPLGQSLSIESPTSKADSVELPSSIASSGEELRAAAGEETYFEPVHASQALKVGENASWSDAIAILHSRNLLFIGSNIGKSVLWFALANTAVMLTLLLVSAGALLPLAPVILLLGCITPFVMLLFSRQFAISAFNMRKVSPSAFGNISEEQLYSAVQVLAMKAGLVKPPEVWIYAGSDINAFATGPGRSNALIAFSTGLLDRLDPRGISAVAAHEIAHIVNGDMLTMTIVQSVVNMVTLLITIPLWITNFMAGILSGCLGGLAGCLAELSRWMLVFITWIVTSVVFVLGLIVVMAFSRKREYAADAIAARLVDSDSMVHALEILGTDTPETQIQQQQFATFKINNRPGWTWIFSSHPSIESRIARIRELGLPL